MTIDITKLFVSSLQLLMNEEPSESDVNQVSRCLIDYLGATFAGGHILENKTSSLAQLLGHGSAIVNPIGMVSKVSLETAALINGLHSHEAEMDDGIRFGMVHPGAPLFSALLPVAEVYKVQARDFIKGVLIGYEATIRLARAVQPSHYRKGYHPTATCGCIGATMGIAAMLGFNADEMEDALGAAAISASGSLKVVDNGSELKPYNVGRAAAIAVQSAMIGKSGFSAPPNTLGGDTGFFSMTSDFPSLSCLDERDAKGYWIHSIYVKPYAACRHAHPSIEGVISILQREKFAIQEVKNVVIKTYHGLKGRHDNQNVTCTSSARMSIPFSVAIALSTRNAGINEFSQVMVDSPELHALARKIFIEENQCYTDLVPAQRPAMILIELGNGQIFSEEVIYAKGEPENPMMLEDIELKYLELSKFSGIPLELAKALLERAWKISNNLDVFFSAMKNCAWIRKND
ncbi:MmgE/PrpD family protein [Vibrio fluminensis]|uniref:MmgE/PrpD family protein n=1 Tax=Vibrio fluminensis TaxID=2783614 RepID=UPI001886C997|nr:MmgE/PrpD family protein [Vibrio fluminensis]